MPEFGDRLRPLELIEVPDLREEIRGWQPRHPPVEPRRRRVLVAVVALIVAGTGIGLVVRAFRASEQAPEPAATVRNGRIAFAAYSGSRWQVFSVEPDGSQPTQLTSLPTDQFHPAWSADGGKIAFSAQGAEGHVEIYVMDGDGSNLEQLTEGPGWSYLPAWSPDGSRIAFVSNRAGNDEIYVMDADGSDQVRLTDDQDEDLSPAWSPDGTRIAFQSNRTGNNEIFVMSALGTDVRNLTDASTSGEFDPAWSPDGTRIAFASDRDGNPEIYLMNADGSGLKRLTNNAAHDWNPTWAPDGSRIAFESDRDGSVAVYTMEIDGTSVARLTDAAEACCPSWQPVLPSAIVPTPTLNPRVTATIPVGSYPRDVAVGAGAVWVSVNDFREGEPESHTVLRIDPATNDIVATIPVHSAGHLALGSDAVWTIDWLAGEGGDALLRIDPTSNEVVATIPVGRYAFDVAVDSTSVWLTREDGEGRSGEVIRIDPSTNEIVARIPVQGRIRDLVVGEGGVWVHDSREGGPSLIHIDPVTERVVGRIPGLAVGDVAAGAGVVWLQGWLSTIDPSVGTGAGDRLLALRIDPATDGLVGEPIRLDWFRPFAVDADGIWFVGEGPSVSRLNTQDFEVDHSVPVEPVATDSAIHASFDPSTGTIWVANYEDTVTRIDLR